jgi:hypothetical protein
LVGVTDSGVQLLKENGKTTTVEMRRLSDADRDYVGVLVATYGQTELGQFAAR